MATTDRKLEIRDVTDEEVAHYRQNGWVLLRELVPAALAAERGETVRAAIEQGNADMVVGQHVSGGHVRDRADRRDWHFVARDEGLEPFRSVAYARQIGKNAQRFIGRDVPVNYHADLMAVKMPEGHAASQPTGFHQDWVNFPFDRIGFLT